jgi:hypothetical protein
VERFYRHLRHDGALIVDAARYYALEMNILLELTAEEIAEGWHFCPDWDGMLLGPGMVEFNECCSCKKDH